MKRDRNVKTSLRRSSVGKPGSHTVSRSAHTQNPTVNGATVIARKKTCTSRVLLEGDIFIEKVAGEKDAQ